MSTETTSPREYPKTVQFHYSHGALAAFVAGVLMTIAPVPYAAVALAGLIVLWAGLYLFMSRSVKTIKLWATMMVAIGAWLGLVLVSGSVGRWAPSAGATASEAAAPQARATGVDLGASLQPSGRLQLLLTNHSAETWTDVRLSMKASDGATYTLDVDDVAPRATVVLPLSRFVDANGHVFRTATVRPQTIAVSATAGGAPGTYEIGWQ